MEETATLRKFVAPEYIFGSGARHYAGTYARNLGGQRALLVSDPGVVAAGWAQQVKEDLEKAGLAVTTFTGVSPNPRVEEVMAGAEVFNSNNCNILVAVGGGSPMDCAKGIGIVTSNRLPILSFEGVDKVVVPMPPLICIPTTGGTSADVSQFAIITDLLERRKFAIISKSVVPDLSLIDPETLTTMDPFLTACAGLDALTHGIEAFVSNASSPMTDLHALEAIRLINTHLVDSIRNPDDVELRAKIMLGSLQAGLAFSNAILGANHAMAHSLGGERDAPHGQCNAILLDHVMAFNLPASPERFDRIAAAMDIDLRGLDEKARRRALLQHVRKLKVEAGLNRILSDLGVTRSDLPVLSRKALRDPCLITNPRKASQRDLEVIYEESL
ncbi:MAG: alcohol dehydrogenase-like regulatory protein ErcA [Syntrophotaleaceae bacterium]